MSPANPEAPGSSRSRIGPAAWTEEGQGVVTVVREAVQRALLRFEPSMRDASLGTVVRMTIDVATTDGVELVSLRLGEPGRPVRWSCSCGAPECNHAAQALRLLLAGQALLAPAGGAEEGLRFSVVPSPPGQTGQGGAGLAASIMPPRDAQRPADLLALAESLEDVVTAVVRTGLLVKDAPAVFESLERLVKAAPAPLTVGVSRWIGRMRWELSRHDPDGVARMLDGASRLVDDLRHGTHDAVGRARLRGWLGAAVDEEGALDLLSDRTLIELGRELLDGAERMSIERRHLIDLQSGELLCEEGIRGQQSVSLGTCPRVVQVGLASVERGPLPSRIRLLQYASSAVVGDAHFHAIAGRAARAFAPLVEIYRSALQDFPGLAEPVVCVGPERLEEGPEPQLVDQRGDRLRLHGGARPSTLAYLTQQFEGATPDFIVGRLLGRGGVLYMRPLAGVVTTDGRMRHFVL